MTTKTKPDTLGWITHTDFRSDDPAATKDWAKKVIGWKFGTPVHGPDGEGEYQVFSYSDQGGGGIQYTMKGQPTAAVPFVNVEDCREAYAKALDAGAKPEYEPKDMGPVTIATVKAPGNVIIGFSSANDEAEE